VIEHQRNAILRRRVRALRAVIEVQRETLAPLGGSSFDDE
jgi:hypothetical protein